MAHLISSWSSKVKAVPPSHVIPLHERPEDAVPIVKDIPVIDLGQAKGEKRVVVVQQLLKACEEYAAFQVINHCVSENLMNESMKIYEEFFNLPVDKKASYAANNSESGALYTSGAKFFGTKSEHRYWRDTLAHNCNVGRDDTQTWPDTPQRFREVIGLYSDEVRKLSKMILGLINEGLGLEAGYFDNELGQRMLANYYPACPDPSSTLGVGAHCDPNLLTLIQQQVYGLQILKDGKWIGVEPLPHAFLVNAGLSLTVISNGKLASVAHRVVTNTTQPRTSLGTFIYAQDLLEPAKSLITPSNPPLFKSFKWGSEFMPHYLTMKSVSDEALEAFKLN